MSIKLITQAWEPSDVKGSDLLVLLCLADHANDDGICWPSVPRIAERARISERQVQYSINSLIEKGWLVREKMGGNGKATLYRVTVQNVHPTVQNVHPDGERTFTPTVIEPSIESIAVVAAAPSGDDPQSSFLQEEEPPKAQENVTMRRGKAKMATVPLDPQTKAMLSTILFGTPRPAPLRKNHVNIADVWRGMQDMGTPLSEVLRWYNEAWPLDWRGKSGQHPTPTQLLNGVAAWRAEVKVAAPTYREELVLLEEDDE